jgi:hypothetical protein
MKRQTFSYLAVAIITLMTALTSCDKNDDFINVKLLDTETNGFQSRKFMYDNQNRIKEIWTYQGGELNEKAFISYTGDDLTKLEYAYLDEGEFVVMDTRNYVKNGNTISWSVGVEIIEGEGEGSQDFKSTITLNNDGYPEKLEERIVNITSVSTFTYVNGNLSKFTYDTVFSSDSNDPGERNYTYGANRSAYSGCNTPKWFMFLHYFEMASHNAVTRSSYPAATTYSYEFDSFGFPTKCTWKYYDHGTEYITEFKYKN